MSATTGTGTFECPECHRPIRFTIDIETDAKGQLYSSRAKGSPDDHTKPRRASRWTINSR